MYLSVIIPTRNRRDLLLGTLKSLAVATVSDSDFEVLVIDNGSTDGTPEAAEIEFISSHLNLRCVTEPEPGLLSGRHRGVMEARGDVLCFLDDDVIVAKEWLRAIEEAFGDGSIVLVGGPCRPLFLETPPEWIDALWTRDAEGVRLDALSLIDLGDRAKFVDPNLVWGLNLSIRREALYELGGFHPDNIPSTLQRFQGDGETGLTRQAAARGVRALYKPEAAVEHVIPGERLTLEALESRFFYQGVCDSFSRIRERGAPRRWEVYRQGALGFLDGSLSLLSRQRRLVRAYRKGFAFHHRQVLLDPELRDWVMRPDYWDYSLPHGPYFEG